MVFGDSVTALYPSIVCSLTVKLLPSRTYISLSADFSILTLNANKIDATADIGTTVFTIIVTSTTYTSTVIQ